MFAVTCFSYLLFIISPVVVLSRMELTKCAPIILIYNCDHTICPGFSILFLCATVHKA